MSRKEVPRAGLLKAALAGKISNAQGALAHAAERAAVSTVKVPLRRRGPARPPAPAAGPPGAPPAARRRAHARGRVAPEHLRRLQRLPCHREAAGGRGPAAQPQPPCGACAAPSACPPSGSAGAARAAPGGRRKPRWAPSCNSTPAPSRGSRRAAPSWPCTAPSTTPPAPAWPWTSGPPRICTATSPCSSSSCTTYGLPLALYGDRLNVFVRNDPHWTLEEQLRGTQDPTHFGRLLRELGIGFIAAGSPQAKGRIERLWQTLQDRLVSELRLRGIATLEAANAFLPAFLADFNRRFTRAPADATAAWRPAPRDLAALLSCRYTRVVAHDNTVRLGPRWVQLPRRRAYTGRRVEVRECLDGRLLVFADGHCLATQPAPAADSSSAPAAAPARIAAGASAPLRAARPRGAAIPLPPRKRPLHRARARPRPRASRAPRTRGATPPRTPPRTGG